jgi:hypothetical protein
VTASQETGAESLERIPDIRARLRTGVLAGLRTSLQILKVTVPLYVAVDLLKRTPVIDVLGGIFAPAMGIFGLPGEAAFAFIAAFLLNLYAAIAILVPLRLDAFQVTQCGLMMGIAHNLVVEGGVLRSTGARGGLLTVCRILISIGTGLALHAVHRVASG